MNRDVLRQFLTIVSLVFMLVMNGLSQVIPFNGQTSAEISNRLPILFVPENYVFSVWGVIYVGLIAFAIYQALPSQRENVLLRRIGYLFILNGFANGLWLVAFHWNAFWVSVLIMLVVLGTLIGIYWRVGTGRFAVNRRDFWFIQVPFSIYMAWITIATVANVSHALYDSDPNWAGLGISQPAWAVIMLVIAGGIVAILNWRHWGDIAYTAVIVWALVGVYVKQVDTPVVAITALVIAALVVGVALLRKFRAREVSLPSVAQLMPVQA